VAWIGAALLACNPYAVAYSADVQSEGLFQLCFLTAVAFSWSALKRAQPALAGWAGFSAALAYLTRPEGLGVAVAAAAVALLLVLRRKWPLTTAVPWAVALVAGVLVVTAPYLVWLRADQGEWSLSQKKSLAALTGAARDGDARPSVGFAPGAEVLFTEEVMRLRYSWRAREREARESRGVEEPSSLAKGVGALGALAHKTVSAVRPEIVLFAAIGVLLGRGGIGLRGQFVLAVIAIYWVAVWGLAFNYGYLSRRHVISPALLLLGYAALAVPVVGRALLAAGRRFLGRAGSPALPAATALVLALLVAVALGKQWRPQRPHNLVEREAADWVGAHLDPAGPVAAGKRRVAYYAGAPWFPLRKIPGGAPLVVALRSNGVRFVVADEDDVATYPELANPDGSGLRVVYEARAKGESATVYEVGIMEGG
jgi:4-amino-4-deoxy-L-arabinose transferase-like glycosyltransferase